MLTFKPLAYHLMKMLKHNNCKKELLSKVVMLSFALRKIWFLLFFNVKLRLEKEEKLTWIQINFLVAYVTSIWKEGGLSGHFLNY